MRRLLLICLFVGAVAGKTSPKKIEQVEQKSVPIEEVPVQDTQSDNAALLSSVKSNSYQSSQTRSSSSSSNQRSGSWGPSFGTDSLVTYNPVRYSIKTSSRGSNQPIIHGAVRQVSRTVSFRNVEMPATSARPPMRIEIGPSSNQLHFLFKSRSSPMFATFGSSPSAAAPDTSAYFSSQEQPMRLVQTVRKPVVYETMQIMRPVQYRTLVMMPTQQSTTRVVSTSSSEGRHSQAPQSSKVFQWQGKGQGQVEQIQAGQIYEIPTQTRMITPSGSYSYSTSSRYSSPQTYFQPAKVTQVNSGKTAMEAAREILGASRFDDLYGNSNIVTQSKPIFTSTQKKTQSYSQPTSKSSYTYEYSSSSTSGTIRSPGTGQVYTRIQSVPQTYVSQVQSNIRPAAVHVVQTPKATPTQSVTSYGQNEQFQQRRVDDQPIQWSTPATVSVQSSRVQEVQPLPSPVQVSSVQVQQTQQPISVPVQQQQVYQQQVQPLTLPVQVARVQQVQQPISVPLQSQPVYQQAVQPLSVPASQSFYQSQSQATPVVQTQVQQEAQSLNVPFVSEQLVPSFQTTRTVQVRPLVQEDYLITPQSPQIKVVQKAQTVANSNEQSQQTQNQFQQQQQVQTQEAQPLQTQTTGTAVAVETTAPAAPAVNFRTVTQPVVFNKVQTKYVQQGSVQSSQQSESSTSSAVSSEPVSVPIADNQLQQSSVEYAQPAIQDQTVSTGSPTQTQTNAVSSSATQQQQQSSSVAYGTRLQSAQPASELDQTEQVQQQRLEDDGVDS